MLQSSVQEFTLHSNKGPCNLKKKVKHGKRSDVLKEIITELDKGSYGEEVVYMMQPRE